MYHATCPHLLPLSHPIVNHRPIRRVLSLLQAYIGLLELSSARDKYSEFCVPMVMVPATVSNNVPGSDLSIGSDTALNAITDVSDAAATVRHTNASTWPVSVGGCRRSATRSLFSTTRNSTSCQLVCQFALQNLLECADAHNLSCTKSSGCEVDSDKAF